MIPLNDDNTALGFTLINLSDYRDDWVCVYTHDGECSTLQVYECKATGELEIVQSNDDNEVIRLVLSRSDADALREALNNATKN